MEEQVKVILEEFKVIESNVFKLLEQSENRIDNTNRIMGELSKITSNLSSIYNSQTSALFEQIKYLQGIIDEKDADIRKKDVVIIDKDSIIKDKDKLLVSKDATITQLINGKERLLNIIDKFAEGALRNAINVHTDVK